MHNSPPRLPHSPLGLAVNDFTDDHHSQSTSTPHTPTTPTTPTDMTRIGSQSPPPPLPVQTGPSIQHHKHQSSGSSQQARNFSRPSRPVTATSPQSKYEHGPTFYDDDSRDRSGSWVNSTRQAQQFTTLELSTLPEQSIHRVHRTGNDSHYDVEKAAEGSVASASTLIANEDHANQDRYQGKITSAKDWAGPDDPENPLNWSWAKKWYHVLIVGLQSFTVTFGTSVYSPAVGEIAKIFHVSTTMAIVPLSVYVLGLAFGPLLSAPISETWGRRQVYMVLFPISLLFSLGAALSQSYGVLVACRLLAGLIGSGCLAVGGGSTSDMFDAAHRGPAVAMFVVWPFLGPAFAPPVGSYALEYKGWRWPLYTVLMLGAFTMLTTLPMQETHKRIILQKRAKRLGIEPPPNPLPADIKTKIKAILWITLLRPVRMLVTEPIVAFLSVYTAFNFAVLFGFFAAFPVVFRSVYPEVQVYRFSVSEAGLVFLGIALGCFIATALFIIIDRLQYRAKCRQIPDSEGKSSITLTPEQRMPAAMIGCVLLPISLFWFAWTARSDIPWIVPVLSTVVFGCGNLLVFDSAMVYLTDAYGALESASAAAANGLLRYVAGAVFPLFMIQFIRAVDVAWCVSILGFVTVGLCPIPWVLYRWGHKIRGKSALAPSK